MTVGTWAVSCPAVGERTPRSIPWRSVTLWTILALMLGALAWLLAYVFRQMMDPELRRAVLDPAQRVYTVGGVLRNWPLFGTLAVAFVAFSLLLAWWVWRMVKRHRGGGFDVIRKEDDQ
jgi:uncharacterized membrane protein AbrB (regulator of aidB expression)